MSLPDEEGSSFCKCREPKILVKGKKIAFLK
jgi:hypothetical protein